MHFTAAVVRIVMFVSLPLAVACAGPAQVADTEQIRQERAGTLARLSAEGGTLRDMLDGGAELAQVSTAESLELEMKRELTDEEEGRVFEIFRKALAEILTQKEHERILTEVISAHFTASEMAEALAFYQSPIGAKILQLDLTLAQEIDAKTDALFDDHLDKFIARIDKDLENEFEELRIGEEQ